MFRKNIIWILALGIHLSACIGVDVVPNEDISLAELSIDTSLDSLRIGDNFQLMATLSNAAGVNISTDQISWSSLNPEIASTDQSGLLTALQEGKATITAKYNSLSDSISFFVGQNTVVTTERKLNFSGRNGYAVDGSGTLSLKQEELILTFDDSFSAQSGPGLVVYLSNSKSSVQAGIEIEPLKANSGNQSYNITQILSSKGEQEMLSLHSYDFVIIYCKPFGVIFGVGTLQP